MAYFGPEYFNCNHKNLTKNKFSNYTCDKCNKDFVMIPAKHEPLHPPHFPSHSPPNPHLPNFPSHNPNRRKYPKYF